MILTEPEFPIARALFALILTRSGIADCLHPERCFTSPMNSKLLPSSAPAARPAKALKGYWSHGRFVKPEEIALEEVGPPSRTQLKAEADEKQALGEALVTLRADLLAKLDLPDKLRDAITEAKRITHFEGRRRQMQFIGKLMRPLDAAPVRAAIAEQAGGSAASTLALHLAEQWRDRLIASDAALAEWLDLHPSIAAGGGGAGSEGGVQPLRALIRQARKDAAADPDKPGAAPRHGKAFREIFQHVRSTMAKAEGEAAAGNGESDGGGDADDGDNTGNDNQSTP